MNTLNIAVIGYGFVGKAVTYGFTTTTTKITIIDPKLNNKTVKDINPIDYDVIFICVPTPMKDNGEIDASILLDTLTYLDNKIKYSLSSTLVVIKSTVTPDIADLYFNNAYTVYNPEFLREKTALEDFVNPDFHIFGGSSLTCNMLASIYNSHSNCSTCPVLTCTPAEASFIKYTINSFLALKVTFFNQLYDAINSSNVEANFTNVIKGVDLDKRIGSSHTKVPGFDSKRGFGGSCFPKDTKAFLSYTDTLSVLQEAVSVNNKYRQNYTLDDREIAQNIKF
jgi:UDPglucose 6-dehydrogenase